MTRHRSNHAHLLTTLAFALAIIAGVSGAVRCLVQSPQSRAENYITLSQQALPADPLYAASVAWEAARINPSSQEAWTTLSMALHYNGDEMASIQARKIAARLQSGEENATPLYAMPAELRLSLLALSEGDL